MCLAIPGKILEIYSRGNLKMGKLDFGGVQREVCLEYVPEAVIGQYANVHVGFAINLMSEEDAEETLSLLREIEFLGRDEEAPGISCGEAGFDAVGTDSQERGANK
ncbi:MAG: HypC/HybG/HupF family hydrogenase formation chaperone [Anaerolineales bacterium]|nr:HypC/HybG/HupF family hydrogenase formation chaperone [Anaerolineales bacterium]